MNIEELYKDVAYDEADTYLGTLEYAQGEFYALKKEIDALKTKVQDMMKWEHKGDDALKMCPPEETEKIYLYLVGAQKSLIAAQGKLSDEVKKTYEPVSE